MLSLCKRNNSWRKLRKRILSKGDCLHFFCDRSGCQRLKMCDVIPRGVVCGKIQQRQHLLTNVVHGIQSTTLFPPHERESALLLLCRLTCGRIRPVQTFTAWLEKMRPSRTLLLLLQRPSRVRRHYKQDEPSESDLLHQQTRPNAHQE